MIDSTFDTAAALVFMLCGAYLYRVRGSNLPPRLPRPLEQMLYCSGFAAAGFAAGLPTLTLALAYVGAVAATTMGHGAYMDLGSEPDFNDERPMAWFLPELAKLMGFYDDRKAYDFVGLTMNGVLMTLPFTIAFCYHDMPVEGFISAVAGAGKSLAYSAGWLLERKYRMAVKPTLIGEYGTGAVQWSGFASIMLAHI